MPSSIHGAVWAVPPDPASAAPSATPRWAAGWASLALRAPLVIHLPPPASASAHVALTAFNVVRTRKVALDHPLAPPLSHPPTHASPPDVERSPVTAPSARHTRASSISTWLRSRRPPQESTSLSTPPPSSVRSHAWQVELLAVARAADDTPPVTWSDFDTGANVAGQSNFPSPPRFVFRVANADQANDWASALAPLLDAHQSPVHTPASLAPADATCYSPSAFAQVDVRPNHSPQLSPPPHKASQGLHDGPERNKRNKSVPTDLDSRGKPTLLQRVRILPRVRSDRNLRIASQASQPSTRGGGTFSPLASPVSPMTPTATPAGHQSPLVATRGARTQPSSPELGKDPSPPPKMDLRRYASSSWLHPDRPTMRSCGDLLRTPSRVPSPGPSQTAPSSEPPPSPPLHSHGALELFAGNSPLSPSFRPMHSAEIYSTSQFKTLPRVASMPQIHLESQRRRKRDSFPSTPGARSPLLPAASQLVGPRPPPPRRKRRSLTGSPFTSDEDREIPPDDMKIALRRLEASRPPRPPPTLETEKLRPQALIMAALSPSDGSQATWDALEAVHGPPPPMWRSRTQAVYSTQGWNGHDNQEHLRSLYRFPPLTPPAESDAAPSRVGSALSSVGEPAPGPQPSWARYETGAHITHSVSASGHDHQYAQAQAYGRTQTSAPGREAYLFDQRLSPASTAGADEDTERDHNFLATTPASDFDIGRPPSCASFPASASARLSLLAPGRGPGRALPYPCVPPPLH